MITLGVLMLILIPTLFGVIFVRCFIKDDDLGHSRIILFFYCLNHSIMSAGKMLTQKGKWILWDSFSAIYAITIIRYLLPLCSITLVTAFIIVKVDKNIRKRFLDTFSSIFICMLTLCVVLLGLHISNLDFVCISGISAILTVIVLFVEENTDNNLGYSLSLTKKWLYTISILLLYVVTVDIYIPSTLFIGNISELEMPFVTIMKILIVTSVLVLVVLSALINYFVKEQHFYILMRVLFVIILTGYIQANFLNGKLTVMDGSHQTWDNVTLIFNVLIWLLFIGIGIYAVMKKFFEGIKITFWGSLAVCIMQLSSLIVLLLSSPIATTTRQDGFISTKSMLDLRNDNNIIVFVLDWFDEQIMEQLISEDEDALNCFEDFVWYQNTTSQYALTDQSIPFLLTGVEWEYGVKLEDYRDYAFSHSDFLNEISDAGYSIGLYTVDKDLGKEAHEIMDNYETELKKKCYWIKTVEFMEKCARYNMAPFIGKSLFWYSTSHINNIIANDNIYHYDCDAYFYKNLTEKHIRIVDDKNGAFRFYHLFGAHYPYTLTAVAERQDPTSLDEQASGCIFILKEYIKQLKELGIYENSTIIITADHGQNAAIGNEEDARKINMKTTSNPVFMIKASGRAGVEKIEIKKAPLTHGEFIPTVLAIIGKDSSRYGRTIYEVDEDEERTRKFVVGYKSDYYMEFLINGDVGDFDNWEQIK